MHYFNSGVVQGDLEALTCLGWREACLSATLQIVYFKKRYAHIIIIIII